MEASEWFFKNIDMFNEEGYVSIHIDELVSKGDFFENGIKILNSLRKDIKNSKFSIPSMKIELQYELSTSNRIFKGVPLSSIDLIDEIDRNNPPELIINKREKGYIDYTPKMEYYMCPLPFNIKGLDSNIFDSYYTEYRTIDDLLMNQPFTCWLNMNYIPHSR